MEPSPEVRERHPERSTKRSFVSSSIPFRSAPRNIWSSFGSLGAMAAVVLLTALIVGLVVLWRENQCDCKSELAQRAGVCRTRHHAGRESD